MLSTGTVQRGFTLIEVAIVLVIIGLIVGGVLAGQNLIHTATLRKHVSEMEKLDTALNTFRLKYDGLAGDIANADSFGLEKGCSFYGYRIIANIGGIGNGDGVLGGAYPANEGSLVFCNLYNAGLSSYNSNAGPVSFGSYAGIPLNCWSGTCNIIPSTANSSLFIMALAGNPNVLTMPAASGFYFFIVGGSAPQMCDKTSFTPADLSYIDLKMDDGLPNSGNVQAVNPGGPGVYPALPGTSGAAGSANCENSSTVPPSYNIGYAASVVCGAAFKLGGYSNYTGQ